MSSETKSTDNMEVDDKALCLVGSTSDMDNKEIEAIQTDINSLILNINDFMNTQKKSEKAITGYELTNDGNTSEKLDGPSEKCEMNVVVSHATSSPFESDDEPEIEEVDWSVAGPVLQQHVSDLERLQLLNKATSALIRRVRKLAIEKSIKKCEE